jgi:PST family polysaccharide transporter
MGQTGGASLASGLFSLLATKIIAVMLGPVHVAMLATLQQLRQIAMTAATLTGQTALVQGTSALAGTERRDYLRTVLCLMTIATLAVVGLMLLAPGAVARFAGLDPQNATNTVLVRWLTIPVVFSAAYVFLAALLNALGAIGPLALVQLAAPAAMAVFAYPLARMVSAGNDTLLVALLAASAMVSVGVAWLALRGHVDLLREWFIATQQASWLAGAWWSETSARRFFAISGSMLAGGLVTHFSLVTIRARILRGQGLATGGQFDAAWAISMNQASLVLASLQTYYLPTLARTQDRSERQAHIARVLTIATIVATAIICTLVIAKPMVVRILYSQQFGETARYLRWTLIGDYLKIASWMLSIPLVAAANMRAFFAADLTAYVAFVSSAIVLNHWIPAADSAAIAFVVLYATHLVFCGACLWRSGEFRPDARTTTIWVSGLALIVCVSALSWGKP